MEACTSSYLSGLRVGDPRHFGGMSVFPIFSQTKRGPDHILLDEAIKRGVLTVREVSEGGSVPELTVINKGEVPVLLLDGEELAGAKQNRVLNTTILVPGQSELVIPVSCTEHGRWSYTSREFMSSDLIMAAKIKEELIESVSKSLRDRRSYSSDQGRIWQHIAKMARDTGIASPSGAMKDVIEAKKEALEEYLKAFPSEPGQQGLLVFINGAVAGLEVLSRETAYAAIHPKLVKSYAMDCIWENAKQAKEPAPDAADAFLKNVLTSKEEKYQSVGLGCDHRFSGNSVFGSALVHENTPIHITFFSTTNPTITRSEKAEMQRFRSRRRHHQR